MSATDIRLLALVYTLENELVGSSHIRTEPTKKVWDTICVVLDLLHFDGKRAQISVDIMLHVKSGLGGWKF